MKKRRILSLLLAGAMVLSPMASHAMADEGSFSAIRAKEEGSGEEFFDWDSGAVSADVGEFSDFSYEDEYVADDFEEVYDEGEWTDPGEAAQDPEVIEGEGTGWEEIPAEEVQVDPVVEEPEIPQEEPVQVLTEAPVIPETAAPEPEQPMAEVATEAPVVVTPTEAQPEVLPSPTVEPTTEATTETVTETVTEGTTETTTERIDTSLPVQVIKTDSQGGPSTLLRTYAGLKEAIDKEMAREDFNTSEMISILLTGNVTVDDTVNIPGGVSVNIGSAAPNAVISRAGSFGGVLFAVGGVLQFSVARSTDGSDDSSYKLTVDGGAQSNNVTGALVNVLAGGTFGMQDGVTLTRNYTTSAGSAILISSDANSVVLAGGAITHNASTQEGGGAVYADEGFESLDIGAASRTGKLVVSENVNGKNEAGNIVLSSKESTICLGGRMSDSSDIHVYRTKPEDGDGLIENSGLEDDVFADMATSIFTFDDPHFTIDEDGCLAERTVTVTPAGPTPTNTPTPTPTHTPTPTVTGSPVTPTPTHTVTPTPFVPIFITSTPTPTATPTPTNTPVPTATNTPTPTPTVAARAPYVPDISECTASGEIFDSPHQYPAGIRYDFTVHAASAEDHYSDRVEGDGKWVFVYWSIGENGAKQGNLRIGVDSALVNSATYTMWISFRLYTWSVADSQWYDSGRVDHIEKNFQVQGISITPTRRATATPTKSGSSSYSSSGNSGSSSSSSNSSSSTDYVSLTRAASATGAASVTRTASASGAQAGTATTVSTGASTADESPVGTMSILALLSFMAALFVWIKRRNQINL